MKHPRIKHLLFTVLAALMALSLLAVPASALTFTAPTAPMSIDKNAITVAAHAQGNVTPEILGLNNATSRNNELPPDLVKNDEEIERSVTANLNYAGNMAILGVFGTDANDNPNPYLYNYFYNCWAIENDAELAPLGTYILSKNVAGGPMGATTTVVEEYDNISASLYLRPDILIGVDPVTYAGDGSLATTGYTDSINALPENQDDDPDNDYNPYQVVYTAERVYSFLECLYGLSDVVGEIKAADSSRTTRYEDPYVITSNIEKYVKGLEAYVISQIEADNAEMPVVAVVDTSYTDTLLQAGTITEGVYVVNTKDCSTQATTAYSRVAEFVADTTVNIVDAIGTLEMQTGEESTASFDNNYYLVTAGQIAEYADIVLFCDVLSSVPENTGASSTVDTFKESLIRNGANAQAVEAIEYLGSAFDCVGSIGANSVENLLGMAYYTAFCYPQYLNQFEVATYWYENFYHITDKAKLQDMIATNFETSTVQSAYAGVYTTDISTYNAQELESKIVDGMRYYEENEADFKDKLLYQNGKTGETTGWAIDWESGIGQGKKAAEPEVTSDETAPEATAAPAAPASTAAPETTAAPTAAASSGGNATVWIIVAVAVVVIAVVAVVALRKKNRK